MSPHSATDLDAIRLMVMVYDFSVTFLSTDLPSTYSYTLSLHDALPILTLKEPPPANASLGATKLTEPLLAPTDRKIICLKSSHLGTWDAVSGVEKKTV